ncbi:MAG TPA: DNRLRE domain-containing protein [Saprospiraceae bacterium]|nr:DNRLRE domain-containing protein [Saprospiraceae bacterium]HNT19533.1 DNRLRE domain-containing protein [Saprospiraceae bacterium]
MNKQAFRFFLLVQLFVFTWFAGAQTTLTLAPSADNTLYESSSGNISNGKGTKIFAGKTKNGLIRRGLVKFDIAGQVPPGATLSGVRLSLTMDRTITGPQPVSLHGLTREWGEGISMADGEEGGGAAAQNGDATWVHALWPGSPWSKPGGDFIGNASASIQVDGDGIYSWSSAQMIKDAQRWLDTPSVNFGWCIVGNEVSSTTAKQFASRESLSATNRPMLTITYHTLSTSTGKDPGLSAVQVFPNPSTGKFFLINHGRPPVSIAIFNSLGHRVYARTLTVEQNELDLRSQPQGLYWYRIEYGFNKAGTGKLIIYD